MENRLPVAPDQRDVFWRYPKFTASGKSRFGKDFSQAKIQLAEFARSNGLLFRHTQDFPAKCGRKVDGRVAKQLGVETWRRSGNVRQGNANAVVRRAGHHAAAEHGLSPHNLCFFSSP